MVNHPTKPSSDCTFSRKCLPGELGGSPPEPYLGKLLGPFMLPCHGRYIEGRARDDMRNGQCAGAAIMRANVGVATLMPQPLHRLPANTEQVFATYAEFLAHHAEITLEEAKARLREVTPQQLLRHEFARAGVKVRWRKGDPVPEVST